MLTIKKHNESLHGNISTENSALHFVKPILLNTIVMNQ
jgi:hypothetical protein